MDVRKSSLNPYAPSYIPLSKRGKGNEDGPQMKLGNPVSNDKTDMTKLPEIHKSWTPQNPDEESECDLAYLAATFPGLSDQSLADVYYANGCDVESSVDMLKQLELPAEFSQELPDTLDIGDVADYGYLAEGKTAKQKVIYEASGSSCGASKYVQ